MRNISSVLNGRVAELGQQHSIAEEVGVLETALTNLGFPGHVVHSGAAIRGEEGYRASKPFRRTSCARS